MAAKDLRTKKILVAEDVELNQHLTRVLLESRGAQVAIAKNGYEALQLLQHEFFDCILMDVHMPEMDGIEATRQIRRMADPGKASVPIIAVTANVQSEDLRKYREAGMNDYLAKPFNESGLWMVITKNQSRPDLWQTNNDPQSEDMNTKRDGEKLYDLTMIQSVSGGDQEFIKKMILLFIETVPGNVRELVHGVEQQNWDQVGKMAHKLKSTVDSMGINSIREDIRQVENDAKQKKQLDQIPDLVCKIETDINRCIDLLKTEVL
jgi:CheY-like chemotaxis protein